MRFVIVVLTLYGAYYYARRRYQFHDALVVAENHKSAAWSGPVEYFVGLTYYERSDYPKAQEAFSQLLKDHPEDYHTPRALVMLEDAAEYDRDWPTAQDALSRYIDQYPSGPDIDLVRGRLDTLRYRHGSELPPQS